MLVASRSIMCLWLLHSIVAKAYSSFIPGSLSLCTAADGWVTPIVKDGKKGKKKNKGGDAETTNQQQDSAGQDEELDPEKAAKKVMLRKHYTRGINAITG